MMLKDLINALVEVEKKYGGAVEVRYNDVDGNYDTDWTESLDHVETFTLNGNLCVKLT